MACSFLAGDPILSCDKYRHQLKLQMTAEKITWQIELT